MSGDSLYEIQSLDEIQIDGLAVDEDDSDLSDGLSEPGVAGMSSRKSTRSCTTSSAKSIPTVNEHDSESSEILEPESTGMSGRKSTRSSSTSSAKSTRKRKQKYIIPEINQHDSEDSDEILELESTGMSSRKSTRSSSTSSVKSTRKKKTKDTISQINERDSEDSDEHWEPKSVHRADSSSCGKSTKKINCLRQANSDRKGDRKQGM